MISDKREYIDPEIEYACNKCGKSFYKGSAHYHDALIDNNVIFCVDCIVSIAINIKLGGYREIPVSKMDYFYTFLPMILRKNISIFKNNINTIKNRNDNTFVRRMMTSMAITTKQKIC